jgi:hypothetical protein
MLYLKEKRNYERPCSFLSHIHLLECPKHILIKYKISGFKMLVFPSLIKRGGKFCKIYSSAKTLNSFIPLSHLNFDTS